MTGDHAAAVPSDDRGYLYGDALFETLIVRDGRLLWPALHFERLVAGLERLLMRADTRALLAEVEDAASLAPKPHAIIRLTLSRCGGARGYAPPGDSGTRYRIHYQALENDPLQSGAPLQVGYSRIALSRQPALAGIKHCNRLEQVLAAAEAAERGLDDVLLKTEDGIVHSSSRGNLFAVVGNELFTAPCDDHGIAGTRRRLILEQLATEAGLQIRIEGLNVSALEAADSVFLCNSVMGIRPVTTVEGATLRSSARAMAAITAMQKQYRESSLLCAA